MTDTWPRRWTGPNFKTKTTSPTKKARAKKRRKLTKVEGANKLKVRERDKRCRFPLCGCHARNLVTHVSHSKHRGMGGNPKGDRTQPELMVLVCAPRHREAIFSIDKGTIRWRALTPAGADGPIAWDVRTKDLFHHFSGSANRKAPGLPEWMELAQEVAGGWAVSAVGNEKAILKWLASMEV